MLVLIRSLMYPSRYHNVVDITIEYYSAAPASQQCTKGFLNEQSLRMIVEAPRDVYDYRSFSFPGIPHLDMSMPFTQSGPLRKMIIAAKFNISVRVSWPELQVIRNGSACANFSTEPKPTGYLNVYEYDLSNTNFNVQAEDTLNISWHGNASAVDSTRFSLAYYQNGTSPTTPMVSVVVDNCTSDITDLLTLNDTLYCGANTEPATNDHEVVSSTQTTEAANGDTTPRSYITNTMDEKAGTTNQNTDISKAKLSTTTIIISGVVSLSLLLLIILLIFVAMYAIVIRQRRESASVNAIGLNGYDNQAQLFHDTSSKTIKLNTF